MTETRKPVQNHPLVGRTIIDNAIVGKLRGRIASVHSNGAISVCWRPGSFSFLKDEDVRNGRYTVEV